MEYFNISKKFYDAGENNLTVVKLKIFKKVNISFDSYN